MTKNLTPEQATQQLIERGLLPAVDGYAQRHFLRRAKEGDLDAVQAYLALGMPVDVRDEDNEGTALIRAAEGDHPAVLRALVQAGADLEARDKDDDTALMTAVNWGSLGALQTLIEVGADVDALSDRNGTPLVSAIDNHKPEIFAALLEAGADVNVVYGEDGHTPLYRALLKERLDYVRALIAAGADVDARTGRHERPLLVSAALQNQVTIAQALVHAGADLNAADALGWTPWRVAGYLEHSDVVDLLEAAGVERHPTPEHDLLQAAQAGDVEGLQAALAAGVSIDSVDPDGDSALALACHTGEAGAVRYLLDQGAATEPQTPENWSPLMFAVNAKCLSCVEILLEHGAAPAAGEGWSPLAKAAQHGEREIVEALLEAGADVDAGDARGQTALMWAAGRENLELLELLIAAGAHLDARACSGSTALNIAVSNHKVEATARLLEAGADPDIPDDLGETPLYEAGTRGYSELVSELLAAGAHPAIPDRNGRFPLTSARSMDKATCAARLVAALTRFPYAQTLKELNLKDPVDPAALPPAFYRRLAERLPAVALVEWARLGEAEVVAGLLATGFPSEGRDGYGRTALVVAASEGYPDVVRALLEAGAEVDARSNINSTALHKAAYGEHVEIVRALLAAGADPNLGDDWRHTPLHTAAESGKVPALAALHAAGGAVDPDPVGDTPLMRAVRFNRPGAAAWLLQAGAALETRNSDLDTALLLAVQKRSPSNVEQLLRAGADPNRAGAGGRTPLMMAAQAGELEILRLLLEAGADPALTDAQGRTALTLAAHREEVVALLNAAAGTEGAAVPVRPIDLPPKPPLHRAAQRGDLERVQQLLAEGAEVDARDGRGDTALLVAAGHGHAVVVQALLEAGADVHAENGVGENAWVRATTFKQEGAEAALKAAGAWTDVDRMAEYMMRLEDFAAALRAGALDRVRLLLESGVVDIDGLVARTHTPLILAVYHGDESMARMLLEAGADPDIPNADGMTPLIVAARTSQWVFVPLLLAAGAAVDVAAPGGVTPLLLAAGEGHVETVAVLLIAGADPQRCNADGVTPLMQAAAAGSVEVVQLLLESGADPRRCDSQGANAAAWATSYEHPNVGRLLREEAREMKTTIDDELRVSTLGANLEKRLGLGRLQAAAWLDDGTVLVATRAALWRWSPGTGTVTPFSNLGPGLLSVNRQAGLAAVVVECPERELVVISLDDGRVVRRLPGHGRQLIKSLVLSPDGRLLASGGSDRMLRVREIASGEELLVLKHPGGFSSMDGNPDVIAWTPDGTRLATADNEKRLWLWDVATGAQQVEVQLPLSARVLAFSPDGATLVAGLEFGGGTISRSDRFLAVLDGRTGELLHLPDTPSEDDDRGENVWAVAFSPDGRFCAVGDDEGSLRSSGAVHIFDTATWQRVVHLPGSRHRLEARRHITISGLEYAPDGAFLLVVIGSEVNRGPVTVEYALEVWDTRSWEPVARLDDFAGTANDHALLPDDGVLVATDRGLRHYTGDEGYTTLLTGKVHRVAAAPDGKHAVVGYASHKGEARLLDLESGEAGELLPAITKGRINSVAFAADSLHYIVCHSDCWVRKVGRKTALRRVPRELVRPRNRLAAAASPDGKFAIVSWQGTLSLLSGDRFEQLITRSHPGPARRLNASAFSPGGQRVAAASGFYRRGIESEDRRGRVFVWQLPEMEVRALLAPQERWFESVAWSPDGVLIAAGTRNGILCLFDAQSGEFLGEILVHGGVITAVQFTSDGGCLVTASEDGSVAVVALGEPGSTA